MNYEQDHLIMSILMMGILEVATMVAMGTTTVREETETEYA
jgi:hypothetical protein